MPGEGTIRKKNWSEVEDRSFLKAGVRYPFRSRRDILRLYCTRRGFAVSMPHVFFTTSDEEKGRHKSEIRKTCCLSKVPGARRRAR